MNSQTARMGGFLPNGFTLVEFLIALVILGVMMTLVFNGLTLGLKTWDTITERTHISRELHLAQLFIKRQLELAQPLRVGAKQGKERIGFTGRRDVIKFISPIPAHIGKGGMYWFTLEVSDQQPSSNQAMQHQDIRHLNLSYQLFQKRTWERFEEAEPDKLVLIDGLEEAEFAYLDSAGNSAQVISSGQWVEQWNDPDRLPQLIRFRFKLAGSDSDRWSELLIAPKLAMMVPARDVGFNGKPMFTAIQ